MYKTSVNQVLIFFKNLSQAAQCWRQVPDLAAALRVTDACANLYMDMNKMVRAGKEYNAMADAYRRIYTRIRVHIFILNKIEKMS